MNLREWMDALIIAFVLAMFIRTFVVELFKIPSGSMSPTLLGDWIAEGLAVDQNGDSHQYLLIANRDGNVQIFHKDKKNKYTYDGRIFEQALTLSQRQLLHRKLHLEEHRIFVNKFAYWFKKPDRGDIVIFRVPFSLDPLPYERNDRAFAPQPFKRSQAVYVKRAVAFDGEVASLDENGWLMINGERVEQPPIFQQIRYNTAGTKEYRVKVPEGQMFVFGDNSDNSADSRMWGGLPYENLRGHAFFRYWPARKMSFLD